MKLLGLVICVLALVGCSMTTTATPDIEKTAEVQVRTIVARAAGQVAAELTANPPTPSPTSTPRPTPTSTPTLEQTTAPTPLPTATVRPTPTRTPPPTLAPTPTPVPRVFGQQYLTTDKVTVTLNSLTVTEVGDSTTVSISYSLKNTTQDPKEEEGWKLFYQGSGGRFFGFLGPLLPGQTIDREFSFSVAAPNGLLALAYPSKFDDESWDEDDLAWNVTQLLLP